MDTDQQKSLPEIEAETEKEFRSKLRANKNRIYAVNLVESLHKKLDKLVGFVQNERKVKFACKAGCSHCCTRLRVELTIPEVFYIAAKINKYPDSERAQILRDVEIYVEKVKGLSPDEHKALGVPCVFLKAGVCSIYEFRPFACRKWHSLDVSACENPAAGIPGNRELVSTANAMLRGFSKAYEKNKLPILPSEFGQALLVGLTDDTALDRWMKGEAVFPRLPESDRDSGAFIASDRPQ